MTTVRFPEISWPKVCSPPSASRSWEDEASASSEAEGNSDDMRYHRQWVVTFEREPFRKLHAFLARNTINLLGIYPRP